MTDDKDEESARGLEKIRIGLREEWGWPSEAEWVWAEPVAENVYALRNLPFYAYGFSYDDHVRVEDRGDFLDVVEVVKRSGHSTYRIFARPDLDGERVKQLLDRLTELKCEFERATKKLMAIDVLPHADVYAVYEALEVAEKAGIVEFEEGHCGHPLRDQTGDKKE